MQRRVSLILASFRDSLLHLYQLECAQRKQTHFNISINKTSLPQKHSARKRLSHPLLQEDAGIF